MGKYEIKFICTRNGVTLSSGPVGTCVDGSTEKEALANFRREHGESETVKYRVLEIKKLH